MAANYLPESHPVHDFKATLRRSFADAYNGPPLEGPLRVTVKLLMPRPSSLNRKRTPNTRVWHTKKPDADNCAKSVMDGLNQIAWQDDKQICDLRVVKMICSDQEPPHVDVTIEPIDEPPANKGYNYDLKVVAVETDEDEIKQR